MDGTRLSVDGVDVRQTDDDLTLVLSAAGVQVMLFRLRYDGWIDEVLNGAGSSAPGPGAWTDRDLSLEFGSPAAATLSFPRDFRLYLDMDDDAIRRVRAALLEILQCACSWWTPLMAASPADVLICRDRFNGRQVSRTPSSHLIIAS